MGKFSFGNISKKRLSECAKPIQDLFMKVIEETDMDFSIGTGFRGEKEQNDAYDKGYSQVKFPNSKHNKQPSEAADVVPYINGKMDWDTVDNFLHLSEIIKRVASEIGIIIESYRDWETDRKSTR